jgi:hypothetical protein
MLVSFVRARRALTKETNIMKLESRHGYSSLKVAKCRW